MTHCGVIMNPLLILARCTCVGALQLFIIVSCIVGDSRGQFIRYKSHELLATTSTMSPSTDDVGGGGIAAAVVVGLFLTGVMIVIVTVVVFMMLGCCGRRRRQSSPTPTAEGNTPQRQNSSLFKVLVNRRTNVKYGASFSENHKTYAQPSSPPSPPGHQNHTDTGELMARYEMMPDHDGVDEVNYETSQSNSTAQQQPSHVPGPNNGPRYSNIPAAASNATFDRVPNEQQAQYEYVVHAAQREKLDESLPAQGVPEVRYEFDESAEEDQNTLQQQQPSNGQSALDMPRDGPLVQHYAVSYATPLTRTMELADVSKNIYRAPARDTTSLYAQLKSFNIKTIASKDLKITQIIGSGQFGNIHKGTWESDRGLVEVAVKTLKSGSNETATVKFLQEAAIMGQFSHPNVVKLYGVSAGEPMRIVLELLPKGDLRNVLISHRKLLDGSEDANNQLCYKLLGYCRQISSAMCYLSSKAFIHRDLAARNILVAADGVCKVADFGMSRDLSETDYYISHGGQIPVKWTAPEAIHFRKYTTASDVWSFGIVMYEIWSLGHKPFESLDNMQALRKVTNGIRLPPPSGCPKPIYSIMIKCWHPSSDDRPTFMEVVKHLSEPNSTLLTWSVLEQSLYSEAMMLAGSMKVAKKLHKDLQEAYV